MFIYILTSPVPLGKLQYVRIGHDNSGEKKRKGWYLSEILIEDMNTKDK